MKFSKLVISILLFVLFLNLSTAKADRRGYVWTYEYMTMPKGQMEIEYYLTTKIPDLHNTGKKNTWEHQLEFEYGITDKLDFAIYQRWQQTNTNTSTGDNFEYTGTKLRTRYRLGEKGKYLVDPLLYFEYIKPDSSLESDVLEGKLILAKNFGKYNVAYNQILKVGINNDGQIEHEYALGLNYELNPRWKFGIESTGNYTSDKYYLGPTVSWSCEKFWVGAGFLRGINDRSDDLRARLIIGIPF